MKSVLVIGRGFLGNYVLKEFQQSGYSVYSSRLKNCSKTDFVIDIQKIDSIKCVVEKINPDLIINCAAITDLDYLEDYPKIGFSINSEGVKNLAKIAKQNKTKLIQISTDGLFDGKKGMYSEDEIPNPINTYGKTKLLAERYVQEESDDYLILRTNFVGYDLDGKNILNWMIKKLSNSEPLIGFDDVVFTPLEVSYLAKSILKSSTLDENHILNLSSNSKISKYQFALMVADIFSFDKKLIQKGKISDVDFKAKRPLDTSLSNEKAKKLLNMDFENLQTSLKNIKNFFLNDGAYLNNEKLQ
ncbi:SDR family oxidoreductase [Nitrosopumilus sp. S6]